ncbi:MAG: galactonate dehydratase [Verrucomicrobia bacterium]|nr:galactonate dehydratase [Verrucomicrobiota bacterium]
MKITDIKAYSIASPVTDWTYVKVETDEPGLFGWGEATLPTKPRGVLGAVQDLKKLLVGRNPLEIRKNWEVCYRHSYWRGGPIITSALSGVDVALWDIFGKVQKQPVYQLLGGAVRDRVPLYANLGLSNDPEEFKRRALEAKAAGYGTVKIYPLPAIQAVEGPQTFRQIVRCCEAVREVMGEEGDFAMDFHGRCSAAFAIRVEAEVRHTHPLWIEEPILPERNHEYALLRPHFKTPVATGERLFTRWGFREVFEKQLVDIIQPDVSNAGGLSEMVRIGAVAETFGMTLNPHNPNSAYQGATSLHLAFHLPNFTALEHRHEHHDFMRRYCSFVPAVESDGAASPPAGVGIGVDMDEEFLRKNPFTDWIPESWRSDGSVGDW